MEQDEKDAAKRALEEREGNSLQREETDKSVEATEPIQETIEENPRSFGTLSNSDQAYKDAAHLEVVSEHGWVTLDSGNMPTYGLFYPEDAIFSIRSARTDEIRHFSTIIEDNPLSISSHLSDILKKCLKITCKSKAMVWQDICQEDRIYIILAIRDLTFVKGENKLVMSTQCSNCEEPIEIPFSNENLRRKDHNGKIFKYYDPEKRIFVVKTKSYGDIKFKPPTLGITDKVTSYIAKARKENKKIDDSFLESLPYMVFDWRGLNETAIAAKYAELKRMEKGHFGVFHTLKGYVDYTVEEKVYSSCPSCHQEEVEATITFPDGIKSIFLISDISSELL